MIIKIKESLIIETNAKRVKNYMLSKALRKEEVSAAEIKKVYGMGDKEYAEAVDKLIKDGAVDKI